MAYPKHFKIVIGDASWLGRKPHTERERDREREKEIERERHRERDRERETVKERQ